MNNTTFIVGIALVTMLGLYVMACVVDMRYLSYLMILKIF